MFGCRMLRSKRATAQIRYRDTGKRIEETVFKRPLRRFWVEPLLQRTDREKEFHFLREEIKLLHRRLQTYFTMLTSQLEALLEQQLPNKAWLISDTLLYVSFKIIAFRICVSIVKQCSVLRDTNIPHNHSDWLMCFFAVRKSGQIDLEPKNKSDDFFPASFLCLLWQNALVQSIV